MPVLSGNLLQSKRVLSRSVEVANDENGDVPMSRGRIKDGFENFLVAELSILRRFRTSVAVDRVQHHVTVSSGSMNRDGDASDTRQVFFVRRRNKIAVKGEEKTW